MFALHGETRNRDEGSCESTKRVATLPKHRDAEKFQLSEKLVQTWVTWEMLWGAREGFKRKRQGKKRF